MSLKAAAAVVVATLSFGVATVATAGASSPTGRVLASPCLNFHNAAKISAPLVGCIPVNKIISINCTVLGDKVTGPYGTESIWDHTTYAGKTGYVADAWVFTNSSVAVSGPCGYPFAYGATLSYNPGAAGNCTWGAESQLHSHFSVYANTLGTNGGDARYWATNAAAHQWKVIASPMRAVANGSIAVFQPGVDGASSLGHVAWVSAVYSNGTFQIYEMNGTAGLGKWDYRTVNNVAGVSFIFV